MNASAPQDAVALDRAERIAQVDAAIKTGRFVGSPEIDDWIASFGSDHELPVPFTVG